MKKYELRIINFKLRIVKILCVFCILGGAAFSAKSQSTNQSYPTAVASNEISGKIPARDIGDARLTDYFYAFNGNQGDIFINVQTSNFNGDIDIFTAGNLKPLTKITIYADDTTRETGRVVYLRQPAKLILRIEGRSPNDDAATFQIKFAGSFQPIETAETAAPQTPEVKSENKSDVRVNSVGTIIEVKPKPQPPKETIAKKETAPRRKKSTAGAKNKENAKEKEVATDEAKDKKAENKEIETEGKIAQTDVDKSGAKAEKTKENSVETEKKSAPVVVVSDDAAKQDAEPVKTEDSTVEKEKSEETKKIDSPKSNAKTIAKSKLRSKGSKTKEPNPLENIHLIILFKDGTRIERAMSEVVRFTVVKGVLTVLTSDGAIGRYSILDIAKTTVE